MKTYISRFTILLALFFSFVLNAQQKVGVNTDQPNAELDVRTTNMNDGADINIANSDNSHYLRLFSGKQDNVFPNPTIYWNQTDSLVFGSFGSQFIEFARINSDGDFLIQEGGIAIGLNSTNGFMEILVDSSFINNQIDQESFSSNFIQVSLSTNNAIGQSFTAGITGSLTAAIIPDAIISSGSSSFIKLEIFEGNSPGGNLIGSGSAKVICQGLLNCGIPTSVSFTNIDIQQGQEYFMVFSLELGADILILIDENNNYSNGSAWSFSNNAWTQMSNFDVLFQTQIGIADSTRVPFFKLTNEGANSKVQIKDYFLPTQKGTPGQVMVASATGQLIWSAKEDTDWQINSNTVFTNSKNVGIGNISPDTRLHIVATEENDGTAAAIKIETPGSGGNPDELMLIDGNEIDAWGGEASGDNDMLLLQRNSSGDINMLQGGGELGIGAQNPGNAKVFIQQNVSFEPNLSLAKSGSFLHLDNNTIWGEDALGGYEPLDIQPYGELILTRHNGVVGMGTANVPDGFQLAVKGKIITEEVLVQSFDDWPDYVFKRNYKLSPLQEVKRFIEQHHHLPNIPSEKEVYENGIELGEMQKKLLEKIEELTLYIIQQEERINKLESQLKNNSHAN